MQPATHRPFVFIHIPGCTFIFQFPGIDFVISKIFLYFI
jgi:hypothetical protein